jgi:hypothetical protein
MMSTNTPMENSILNQAGTPIDVAKVPTIKETPATDSA